MLRYDDNIYIIYVFNSVLNIIKFVYFEFEKYLNPTLLKDVDTNSDEFKEIVRSLNYISKTRYEALQYKKKNFSKL